MRKRSKPWRRKLLDIGRKNSHDACPSWKLGIQMQEISLRLCKESGALLSKNGAWKDDSKVQVLCSNLSLVSIQIEAKQC